MFGRRQSRLLAPGSRAADFRLRALQGDERSLTDLLASGPVLLAFFKVSCPVCQFTLPFLDRIHAPGRLAVWAVSQNDAADTREFLRRYGVGVPTLLDSEDGGFPASNAYGISTVPTLFEVERDGTIARVVEGWSRKEIEMLGRTAGVNPIQAGEKVPEWKSG